MVWTKLPPKPKTSQFILYIDLVSSKFNLKFSNLAELVYLVLKGVFCIFFFFFWCGFFRILYIQDHVTYKYSFTLSFPFFVLFTGISHFIGFCVIAL